jgi:hypothetical protein
VQSQVREFIFRSESVASARPETTPTGQRDILRSEGYPQVRGVSSGQRGILRSESKSSGQIFFSSESSSSGQRVHPQVIEFILRSPEIHPHVREYIIWPDLQGQKTQSNVREHILMSESTSSGQ